MNVNRERRFIQNSTEVCYDVFRDLLNGLGNKNVDLIKFFRFC